MECVVWSFSRGDPCESFASLRRSDHGTPEFVADVPTPIEDRECCALTRVPLRRPDSHLVLTAASRLRGGEEETGRRSPDGDTATQSRGRASRAVR